MKQYFTFFRIRFAASLQYRAAAWAGVATQFAWGSMLISLYAAFYRGNPADFPMEFSALSSYIWLQQAFLALYSSWFFDRDTLDSITQGTIAYDLCRPVSLYWMWFWKDTATRIARAALRCMPILIFSAFLPAPYGLSLPADGVSFLLFLLTMILALWMANAFTLLIYILCFYTMSPMGLRTLSTTAIEFFSGALIPLPFLPDGFRQFCELLPFASMQNLPFRVYSGDLAGYEAVFFIFLQLFWILCFTLLEQLLLKRALKKVVVQGG